MELLRARTLHTLVAAVLGATLVAGCTERADDVAQTQQPGDVPAASPSVSPTAAAEPELDSDADADLVEAAATEEAAPEASSPASPEPEPSPAAAGTARAAAEALTVKGRAPKTGYAREEFGSGWVDTDRNGCDTRNDMLALRLENVVAEGTCKVMSGDLLDPFTGEWIAFERGGASEVDIDHLVALSDAWQKGAFQWEYAQRVAFANDPLNLEPVDAGQNRSKGDGDAATWLPPNKDFRCQYVARQVAVKTKYEVWVTQAELDAVLRVLDTCPGEPLPDEGTHPVIAENTGGPAPSETAASAPVEAEPEETSQATAPAEDVYYANCTAVREAGAAPIHRGEPGYRKALDRDGDGIGCE
ncbi:excalibur calcium-binding domain-containing protein [Demequina pelophila]|uniref:excalibur calcium-binding domain-containing protein n=1 Tax=Demequina pelophila TaxID=1638984 RepID=UPI000785998E|nr:excalibur calcium-binding domain-containing protein [Demequina pelophila]